jgi:hypothetical protein
MKADTGRKPRDKEVAIAFLVAGIALTAAIIKRVVKKP